MPAATARATTKQSRSPALANPALPLDKPSKELFAQMVADMIPVREAYERAGYKGNEYSRSQLRRSPDVDARVKWLLANRVDAATKARVRGEEKIVDARLRLMREYERLAYANIGDVVAWDKRPILGEDGSVQGFVDEVVATPSRKLKPGQMAAIKSVKTKAGVIQIEQHDKLLAMNSLAKVLGITLDAAPVAQSVTVNQINVGEVQALEAARRVAFLLSSVPASAQPEPRTIDHEPSPKGKPER